MSHLTFWHLIDEAKFLQSWRNTTIFFPESKRRAFVTYLWTHRIGHFYLFFNTPS